MVCVTIAFLLPYADATKDLRDNFVIRKNVRRTVQDMVYVRRVFVRATIRTGVQIVVNTAHAVMGAVHTVDVQVRTAHVRKDGLEEIACILIVSNKISQRVRAQELVVDMVLV